MNRRPHLPPGLLRWLGAALLVLVLVALSVAGLLMASDATVGRARLGAYYPSLLTAAGLFAAVLSAIIVSQLLRLWRSVRQREPGARLSRRMFALFVLLALPPAVLVFAFGLNFLFGAVDSRFSAPVGTALDDALEVGQLYLEERRDEAERVTVELAAELALDPRSSWPERIDDAIDRIGALQLSVFAAAGGALASSSADPDWLQPDTPPEHLRLRLGAQRGFALVESHGDGVVLRALARIDEGPRSARAAIVQAVFPVPARYALLAHRIESAVAEYRRLDFLRESLKLSMALILGLVLLLVLLAALLLALRAARRIAQPVAQLAQATAAIGRGEYGHQLPRPAHQDELGDLSLAFNRMSEALDAAQERERRQQDLVEAQRAYLDAVLSRISSAVIGFDGHGRVRLLNNAGERLLAIAASQADGLDPEALIAARPDLAPFVARIEEHLRSRGEAWSEEVRIERETGVQVLLLRGSPLREPDGGHGHLVVFDDATALNRAQRDAAWTEVARRLAHEIRNPLTPIQLAAERLRRRYLGRLPPDDAEVLERATGTIVNQVESLKSLVNAFADYARPMPVRASRIGLNALVADVLELYAQDPRLHIQRNLAEQELLLRADPDRLRQVLHNLVKNAIEAMASQQSLRLQVATGSQTHEDRRWAWIEVRDHGPGLPDGFDLSTLEPYRSSKPRGSGLGLVIVQRIIAEHGGQLEAGTAEGGGACFRIRLPL